MQKYLEYRLIRTNFAKRFCWKLSNNVFVFFSLFLFQFAIRRNQTEIQSMLYSWNNTWTHHSDRTATIPYPNWSLKTPWRSSNVPNSICKCSATIRMQQRRRPPIKNRFYLNCINGKTWTIWIWACGKVSGHSTFRQISSAVWPVLVNHSLDPGWRQASKSHSSHKHRYHQMDQQKRHRPHRQPCQWSICETSISNDLAHIRYRSSIHHQTAHQISLLECMQASEVKQFNCIIVRFLNLKSNL